MRVCECRSVGMYLCAQPFQCVLCVGIAEHKAAAVAATFVCISIMHSMRDILFSFVGHIQRVCLASRLPPFFYPFKFSGIAEIRSEKYRQYYGYSTTLCTTQSIWAMVWWWVLLLVMVFTFFFYHSVSCHFCESSCYHKFVAATCVAISRAHLKWLRYCHSECIWTRKLKRKTNGIFRFISFCANKHDQK